MYKQALIAAAILGGTAVIIGAFGAHALKSIFTPEQLTSFETGVKYQFYHAIVLGIVALLYNKLNKRTLNLCTWFFTSGITMFSGSIYLLNFLKAKDIIGLKGLGIITPIGGLVLIAGWATLLFGAINYTRK